MPAKFLSNLFLNLILSLVTLKGRREQKQKIVSFPNLFCCLTLLHTEKLPLSSADFENFYKIKMSMFSWLINIHYLTFIYIILFASIPFSFCILKERKAVFSWPNENTATTNEKPTCVQWSPARENANSLPQYCLQRDYSSLSLTWNTVISQQTLEMKITFICFNKKVN